MNELARLTARVDELLLANNGLVEENRALKRAAEPEPEYVFGPWFTPDREFPAGVEYQCREDGDAKIHTLDDNEVGEPWWPGTKIRRAYRVDEWYDHMTSTCPFAGNPRIQVQLRSLAMCKGRADGFAWGELGGSTVIRFRALANTDA